MFIPGSIIAILTILAGLIAYLVAIVVRVVLILIKEELNLKIKIGPETKEPE